MEQVEEAQGELAGHTTRVGELDERLATLTASRDEKLATLDADLADLESRRGPTAEGLPADLLALYDRLREAKGGVGAAKVHQGRCTGCQLGLDRAELARIKALPADEVVRCEECSRILVRTPDSGL